MTSHSNELNDIIVTIDTREQNKKRIKAVEDWTVSHGGIIEHSKLDLCDYRILGDFRGIPVNLGIEAKGLHDFATSFQDLPDKLARSYKLYDDVALFVECGNYTFQVDPDGFHAVIDNPSVRNGDANVLPLTVMENMLESFQKEGIHVRQLRSEAHFPYALAGLLINIVKSIHTGLEINDVKIRDAIGTERYNELIKKNYISQYRNVLCKMPGIGDKRAGKIMKHYPALEWLVSASSQSLETVLGVKAGRNLDHFIHCHDLVTDAWRNGYHQDGTIREIDNSDDNFSNKIKCAITDYLTEEYPNALTVDELCDHFNIEQGDDDKESFLIYLKELAWEKKITNTVTGLFIINKQYYNDKSAGGLVPKLPPLIIPPALLSQSSSTEQVQSAATKKSQTKDAIFPKLGTPDIISNHPGSIFTTTTSKKPDDTQGKIDTTTTPLSPGVQAKDLMKIVPLAVSSTVTSPPLPADTTLLSEADELFGKAHPDWIAESTKRPGKMNLQGRLKIFLEIPRTLQDCTDEFCRDNEFQKGTVFEHVMRMKRDGIVTQFSDGTYVMAVK